MTISVGDTLPNATLLHMQDGRPAAVDLAERIAGKKVVIFGLPGAFSGTCDNVHLPSFLENKAGFDAAGVDEIICVTVNDPFVVGAWDAATGASAGGITILGDSSGAFTKALGVNFDAEVVGFYGRSNRYAMLVENGTVKLFQLDPPQTCAAAMGGPLLEAINSL